MKRFASHYLFLPETGFLKQCIVEMEGDSLSRIFPLTEEIESVEWYPGVIVLTQDIDFSIKKFEQILISSNSHQIMIEKEVASAQIYNINKVYVYLLYPFDFINLRPVAETQHRLLQ